MINMKYKKICPICNTEFETNSPQKMYCNNVHYLPCPVCGKLVEKKDNDFSRPPKCCSTKCRHELRKMNMPKKKCIICGNEFVPRSGVGLICDRQHYRKCEICGKEFELSIRMIHDNVTTCSTECREEKTRRNNMEKYGTEYPMQNEEVKKHFKESMKKKYGVEHALQYSAFSHKQQVTALHTNLEHNGVPYACMLPQCINAQGKIVSNINRKVGDKIKQLTGLEYSFEKRFENYSYDLCIEKIKTLIEVDPSYTHSTVPNHWGQAREVDYHIKKTKIANEHGYRCIHIFDWDDVDKVISILAPKKTIFARKCKIYKLNLKTTRDFLNKYHLQGNCRGQLLCLGLVYDDELFEVMTFGKSRYDKSHTVELLRLCTKSGYTVVGGASRLFKFATEYYGLDDIISYCDLSKFDGSVYEKIGMKKIRTTPPQEVWSRENNKITANLLRARGYDQLFKTNYGKGTSNEQLMFENGWLPVYDCGQAVYEY